LSKPPAQAGPPGTGCPGPRPGPFLISPRMKTPQSLWATRYQCLVTLSIKKHFLVFRQTLLCFSLCPLPLALSLHTTEKSLAPPSLHPSFRYLSLQASLLQDEQSQLSQPFLIGEVLQSLNYLSGPARDTLRYGSCAGEPRTGHSSQSAELLTAVS